MAFVKEAHCGNPSQIMRPAPSRSLAPSVGQIWHITESEMHSEQELLERVQGICREYGQSCASQMTIGSYQALPPEAVSMIDPPERAWLVRLHLVGRERDQTTAQVEAIVVMRGSEVSFMLR